MLNANSLLNQFFGGQSETGQPQDADQTGAGQQQASGLNLQSFLSGPGGLATGALAGGVAGLLMGGKKPRKIAKSALKVGGVALVGGLAYKAWSDWQAKKPLRPTTELAGETPPADSPFLPSAPEEQENLSRSILRAMIAAAKVDGHVSIEEQNRISKHMESMEIGDEHRGFIEDELAKPLDIDAVVSGAKCPEQAAEIYAASLLVVDTSGAAERGYLAMLAARLKLDQMLVEYLHAGIDSAEAQQAA